MAPIAEFELADVVVAAGSAGPATCSTVDAGTANIFIHVFFISIVFFNLRLEYS